MDSKHTKLDKTQQIEKKIISPFGFWQVPHYDTTLSSTWFLPECLTHINLITKLEMLLVSERSSA